MACALSTVNTIFDVNSPAARYIAGRSFFYCAEATRFGEQSSLFGLGRSFRLERLV